MAAARYLNLGIFLEPTEDRMYQLGEFLQSGKERKCLIKGLGSVRIILEPNEYLNKKWPEFWLTHAYMDKLWAAGVPIKKRIHQGLTHMKMLVTSRYATNASSNFAANWQRDHNYFVEKALKPALYQKLKDRVQHERPTHTA